MNILYKNLNIDNSIINNDNYNELVKKYIKYLFLEKTTFTKARLDFKQMIIKTIEKYTSDENIQKLKDKMGLKSSE